MKKKLKLKIKHIKIKSFITSLNDKSIKEFKGGMENAMPTGQLNCDLTYLNDCRPY